MTYLFILLGIALLCAGAALFVLDSRRRSGASSRDDVSSVPAETASGSGEMEETPETDGRQQPRSGPVDEPGAAVEAEVETEIEAEPETASVTEAGVESEVEREAEIEPDPETAIEADTETEDEAESGPEPETAAAPELERDTDIEPETAVEAEPETAPEEASGAESDVAESTDPDDEPLDLGDEPAAAPRRRLRPSFVPRFPTRADLRHLGPLGGLAARRARKAWALDRNADFSKIDTEIASWWSRVPEGDARDVVSGFAHGREMHLCDIGGVTLLALRRPVPSDEIMEFSRDGRTDLPEVGVEDDVTVSATDPEVIHRIFDSRAHRVLRDIPESITAVWAEGEWAIAAFADGSGPGEWDAALTPLAGFGDIARRLPPSPGSIGELDAAHRDPTRPTADDVARAAGADTAAPGHLRPLPDPSAATTPTPATAVAEPAEEAPAWTPPTASDHPLETPTRSVGKRMGDGDFRDLGESGADLPALGEDPEHSRATVTGGRIIRPDSGPAGIFGDATADAEDETETATDTTTDGATAPDADAAAEAETEAEKDDRS
ncbi:hypothetical protein [Corynebacterium freneyi]|uniref:Secreted or membrane protein n=1 Tax=Corynebacterium freneyi TaxID=134034 RepID=A0ABS4U4E9_9CORY|nr:hypothetical protein [Corynebacterium freneyi]MBP2331519.1 hypothetical protein [Corynebacterium freneyi]QXA52012.1 hypothetical protein I6L56_07710 [Corynebacterium freneyi]WJZ06358.1 hypothetical protein CFREN_12120 [Corynebacterium freneyi]